MQSVKTYQITKKTKLGLSTKVGYLAMALLPILGFSATTTEITQQIKGRPPYFSQIGTEFINQGDRPYILAILNGQEQKIPTVNSKIKIGKKADNSPTYMYIDLDNDSDAISHDVKWYIAKEKKGASLKWAPFGTDFMAFEPQFISKHDDVELVEIQQEQISSDGTELTIPLEALGHRIALSITPKSTTGYPISGTPMLLTDLNYIYGQNVVLDTEKQMTDVTTELKGNNFNNGGGYVLDTPFIFDRLVITLDTEFNEVILGYRYRPSENCTYGSSCDQFYQNDIFNDNSKWAFHLKEGINLDTNRIRNWSGVIESTDKTNNRREIVVSFPEEYYGVLDPTKGWTFDMTPRNAFGIQGKPVFVDSSEVSKIVLQPLGFRNLVNESSTNQDITAFDSNLDNIEQLANLRHATQEPPVFAVNVPIYAALGMITNDVEGAQDQQINSISKIDFSDTTYSWYSVPASEMDGEEISTTTLAKYTPVIANQKLDVNFMPNQLSTYPSYTPTENDLGNVIVFKLDMKAMTEDKTVQILSTSMLSSTDTPIGRSNFSKTTDAKSSSVVIRLDEKEVTRFSKP